ncbi:hypothetical protein L7F22_014100 [Adiantum nelumboides]|nr:hypothetical protein [Adiantum nelumboides]
MMADMADLEVQSFLDACMSEQCSELVVQKSMPDRHVERSCSRDAHRCESSTRQMVVTDDSVIQTFLDMLDKEHVDASSLDGQEMHVADTTCQSEMPIARDIYVDACSVLEPIEKNKGWWRQWNLFSRLFPGQIEIVKQTAIDVSEMDGSFKMPLCKILFPFDRHSLKEKQLIGPAISMSLPSFSGKTYDQPDLLKYSCRLKCSVKAVKPATITIPLMVEGAGGVGQDQTLKSILAILAAKPILALCFEKMVMHVEAPIVVAGNSTGSHTLTRKGVATSVIVKAL